MSASALLRRVNHLFMIVATFWAFALAGNITADVIARVVFNDPIIGTTEIITNSVVMIAFLLLPYAVFSGSMLRADFLLKSFPPALGRFFEICGSVLGFLLFAALSWGLIEPMRDAYMRGEFEGDGAFRFPTWPIYAVILTGSVLTTINYLYLVWQSTKNNGEPG